MSYDFGWADKALHFCRQQNAHVVLDPEVCANCPYALEAQLNKERKLQNTPGAVGRLKEESVNHLVSRGTKQALFKIIRL